MEEDQAPTADGAAPTAEPQVETAVPQPWVDNGSNTDDLVIGSLFVIGAALLIIQGIRAWHR